MSAMSVINTLEYILEEYVIENNISILKLNDVPQFEFELQYCDLISTTTSISSSSAAALKLWKVSTYSVIYEGLMSVGLFAEYKFNSDYSIVIYPKWYDNNVPNSLINNIQFSDSNIGFNNSLLEKFTNAATMIIKNNILNKYTFEADSLEAKKYVGKYITDNFSNTGIVTNTKMEMQPMIGSNIVMFKNSMAGKLIHSNNSIFKILNVLRIFEENIDKEYTDEELEKFTDENYPTIVEELSYDDIEFE